MNTASFLRTLKEKKLMLPPLSGYTDYPYRTILARFCPAFLTTEMANARAIVSNNKRTRDILKMTKGTHHNGVQLIGSDPDYMRKAALLVEDLGFDYLDINMGCTARKVTRRGEGVALMKHEQRARELVSTIASAVSLPVTCKLRLGATKQQLNVISLTRKLADAGATALTIHGRTGEKKFGAPVDLTLIKEVVDQLSIPVVTNGGVCSGASALQAMHATGAAAVMPGRALIGNPWLIPEIQHALTKQSFSPPTLAQKKKICRDHFQMLIEFYGERSAVHKMRSILPHYFSSSLFLKQLKRDVHRAESADDIFQLLTHLVEEHAHVVYIPQLSH